MPESLLFHVGRITVLALLCASPVWADSAADRLRDQLQDLDSLGGTFHQVVVNEDGELVQESSGEIIVERPFKLRWETTEPFRYLVMTDGDTLWRYDPDLEQLNTEAFSADLAQAPVLILTAPIEELKAAFEMAWQQRDGSDEFQLTPKTKTAFEQMQLTFAGGVLRRMVLSDSLGQTTTITLDDARKNVGYDDALFVFQEPEPSL